MVKNYCAFFLFIFHVPCPLLAMKDLIPQQASLTSIENSAEGRSRRDKMSLYQPDRTLTVYWGQVAKPALRKQARLAGCFLGLSLFCGIITPLGLSSLNITSQETTDLLIPKCLLVAGGLWLMGVDRAFYRMYRPYPVDTWQNSPLHGKGAGFFQASFERLFCKDTYRFL